MATAARVNASEIIDHSPLRWFHWSVFGLCTLCLMVDGFSLQIIGFAAPSLIREWKIPAATMGPAFGASLVGVLFGSFLFSALADRVGRRPVLIWVTAYYAVFTYLTASATSVDGLISIRFLAGLGLGGIMPNAMALAGEYAPAKKRVAVMMIVSSGFSAGAVVGGLVASRLIPHYGWRSVFWAGGASALAVAALMLVFLPESIPFLLLKGKPAAAVARAIRRLRPDNRLTREGATWFVEERATSGGSLMPLFRDGRVLGTILIWLLNFMNLLNLYFLTNWLPTAIREFGFSNLIALRAGTVLQIGGLVGGIILGLVVQRLGFVHVLTTVFLIGCVSIAAIGLPAAPLKLLFVAFFLAGFCIPGGQTGVNALAAVYYPTDLRSTGIGAGLGVGRLGAILGPWIAGELLLHHWPARDLFLAATIPAVISAMSVVAIRGRLRSDPAAALVPQS